MSTDGLRLDLSECQVYTLKLGLRETTERLRQAGVPSPETDAREIMQRVANLSRLELLMRGEQPIKVRQLRHLEQLTRRREAREPLQYLLSPIEWADLHLNVSPAALIPRPETEVLLALALQTLQRWAAPRVLEVGTGTGALALGVKQARPEAQVMGSDISPEALALARRNAQLNNLDVAFVQADLLTGLSGPYDLLLSNPPYLPDTDRAEAQPEVSFDPELALYSGPDGLDLARRMCQDAPRVLAPGGTLWLELDPRNVEVMAAELRAAGWSAEVHPDLTGRQRFLTARQVGGRVNLDGR
ncbi:peptide chain release factor N(5)-glutamine methyltransferase [Deinococcus rubellus]|uniref:Release factor glutamine methyltransferase n=1 Tax=Deinococcus rubellus TaxID=1889240 RepID=A0ABY5YJ62_9DEIO|nr:peptide chain release factor N(5)-glutamine methyltransferase [Deinococcus rubellus]UWX64855.1 peptide chain release factor N(5)-glutamine methyltransferase [Deinococcus rubellus]